MYNKQNEREIYSKKKIYLFTIERTNDVFLCLICVPIKSDTLLFGKFCVCESCFWHTFEKNKWADRAAVSVYQKQSKRQSFIDIRNCGNQS